MLVFKNKKRSFACSIVLLMSFFIPINNIWASPEIKKEIKKDFKNNVIKSNIHYSKALKQQLKDALQHKPKGYLPRTEHFLDNGKPKYTNRLILEESPYLIQHAHNPVNWYPWGNEAFAQAKKENKPIFLSIGYSTCHWCHVMERESFDNEAVASYLNQHFIAIKVDRERRPDVDKIYMTALMMIKGSGGWPMSSFLTPEGKPFFSATYLPTEQFMMVLQQSEKLWRSEEKKLRLMAEKIINAVKSRQNILKQSEHIGKERVQIAIINLLNQFDELQGGFSSAPKFPNETSLFLLLDMALREQDKEILNALTITMDHMAQGGIYDQVGGGFHRYSTDNDWLVPHFEKMLYNQAHLARAYTQLYNITHKQYYERIAKQTLDYVLRDMQAENNGLYSASDADSQGIEGKFFVWTEKQIKASLPPALAQLAIELYGISAEGNFNEISQANILHLPLSIKQFAHSKHQSEKQLLENIDQIRSLLYQQRQQRVAPAIDKKIVTAWNAMMIASLAQAGHIFSEDKYIDAADHLGEFLWQTHHYENTDPAKKVSSSLWRSSLSGKTSVAAIQADYAYLIQAYISLYDVKKDKKWLTRSEQLMTEMIALFWDKEDATFYMSMAPISEESNGESSEENNPVNLFHRPKDIYDGAIPAANAIALEALSKLYYRTGNDMYLSKAMAMVASLSSQIKTSPSAFSYYLMAINQLNFSELGNIQYGAKGHVRIEQRIKKSQQKTPDTHPLRKSITLTISMDKGWHINSRYPKDEDLRASEVSLGKKALNDWKIIQVEYPEGEEFTLKFNDTPLSLYQNSVQIKLTIEAKNAQVMSIIPIEFAYQTCSDKVCLAPEKNIFYLTKKNSD